MDFLLFYEAVKNLIFSNNRSKGQLISKGLFAILEFFQKN